MWSSFWGQLYKAPLRCEDDEYLTWNPGTGEIEVLPGLFPEYDPPNPEHISSPEDPVTKVRLASGSETHLQAFLTQNYGRFPESEIVFGPTSTLCWVGNEVACGLGMQKIDLLAINEEQNGLTFRIIELKKDPPNTQSAWQLERYIDWTKRFVLGADSSNIQPILLCRNLKRLSLSRKVANSFREFNATGLALPVKYIECTRREDSDGVRFYEVDYGVE